MPRFIFTGPCDLDSLHNTNWDFTLQTHNVVAYLLHITCMHGRWLLWGSINTLNHVSMWFGALTICSEGLRWFAGPARVMKPRNFTNLYPKHLVNLGWPDNVHSSTNPKRVLMSSKHEIHPFHMFWCVLPLPCHLPYQYYRIWNFAPRLHVMCLRDTCQMWPMSGHMYPKHVKSL